MQRLGNIMKKKKTKFCEWKIAGKNWKKSTLT